MRPTFIDHFICLFVGFFVFFFKGFMVVEKGIAGRQEAEERKMQLHFKLILL